MDDSYIFPLTDRLSLYFRTPMERFRCETFHTKEPETLKWIQTFDPGGVFFDVGANIGSYALYAASLYSQMKIYAFEPLESNYQALIQNIRLNRFEEVTALHVAVSDIEGKEPFFIINEQAGSSNSQLSRPLSEEGCEYQPIRETVMSCVTVDGFCERLPHPCTYLKIDIDGQEWRVLKGAERTLKNSIKSVLVELHPKAVEIKAVHEWMADLGFVLDPFLQALPDHSNYRRRLDGPLNFIYSRF